MINNIVFVCVSLEFLNIKRMHRYRLMIFVCFFPSMKLFSACVYSENKDTVVSNVCRQTYANEYQERF